LTRDDISILDASDNHSFQRNPDFLEWLNSDLVRLSEQFVGKYQLIDSSFIKRMAKTFKTSRFELLLKRWIVEYYLRLFRLLDCRNYYMNNGSEIVLEKNPLNQYGIEQYYLQYKCLPRIRWIPQKNILKKIMLIIANVLLIFYGSLKNGIAIKKERKHYVVMREALWGLSNYGYYFHDDYFVDGNVIKKNDLLLFSRGFPTEQGRLNAFHDAKESEYEHFILGYLPISINNFVKVVLRKYFMGGIYAMILSLKLSNFTLINNIFLCFINNALPYEQVFSNYTVKLEYGHDNHSVRHIPESIVCQSHGTRYYLMHWSDNSIKIASNLLSFLGCDKYLLWGESHALHEKNTGNKPNILEPIGYVFKRFIKNVHNSREKVISEMGIQSKGKIISFYDESFGGLIKMTGNHFVTFWETILKLAEKEPEHTVLIKSKGHGRRHSLSDPLKKQYLDIRGKLERMKNVYIIDEKKWSFIECIGVSDIVITQGMTSSATIAIICGINGLYLDQAKYNHPFKELFEDKLVFDDPGELLEMIGKIIREEENPKNCIPDDLLRSFDAYADDRGIDIFRNIIVGKERINEEHKS